MVIAYSFHHKFRQWCVSMCVCLQGYEGHAVWCSWTSSICWQFVTQVLLLLKLCFSNFIFKATDVAVDCSARQHSCCEWSECVLQRQTVKPLWRSLLDLMNASSNTVTRSYARSTPSFQVLNSSVFCAFLGLCKGMHSGSHSGHLGVNVPKNLCPRPCAQT